MFLAFLINLYIILAFLLVPYFTKIDYANIPYITLAVIALIPVVISGIKKKLISHFFKTHLILSIIYFISITSYITYSISDYDFPTNSSIIHIFLLYNIPTFIAVILLLLKIKISQNRKIVHGILNILSVANTIFFYFFTTSLTFICLFFMGLAESMDPKYPTIQEYPQAISKLSDKTYRTKHFPKDISPNMKNYFFITNTDPRGWNIDYLSIYADKEYISNLLKTKEHNILKKINFSEISMYYRYLEVSFDINTPDTYTAYILKNGNNDDNYTSGMVISEEKNNIIFFYANFNLKIEN